MRRFLGSLVLVAMLACFESTDALALHVPDTSENRMAAAQQYLRVVPIRPMFDDVLDQIFRSGQWTISSERLFAEFIGRLDIPMLEAAALESMTRHFTVDEIHALAQFYGSAEGQSIMSKFGAYMAELLPVIQAETRRVNQEIITDFATAPKPKGVEQ